MFLDKRTLGQGPFLPTPLQSNDSVPTACPFDATKLSSKELISKFEGITIEDNDIQDLSKQLHALLSTQLSDKQMSALVSLTYNIGLAGIRGSTLMKSINEHDFKKAAESFLIWDKANGQLNPGLHSRRLCERDLFISP